MMKHRAGRKWCCATELSYTAMLLYGHPVELGEVFALILKIFWIWSVHIFICEI